MQKYHQRSGKLVYDGERYVPGQTSRNVREDHERRYRHVRNQLKGRRILDIACGSGFGIQILSSVSSAIVGIDYSFDAVNFAKRNFMRRADGGVRANTSSIPFVDNSFDAVVSFETIEHLREPVKFLEEIRRVLIPDGQFYISTPVKKGNRLDRYHFHEYTIIEITKLLSRFFSVEKVEGQRFMFTPFFALFSLEWINNLKKISVVKSFYRNCYGKDEIKTLGSATWFTPNFILVTCKNEK